MLKKGTIALFLAGLFFSAGSLFALSSDAVLGTWWSQDKDARFEIYKCGSKFCAKVNWMPEKDVNKTDEKNPDPKLKSRKIMGLQFLSDFKFDGDETWEDGKIYAPQEGKTYSCKMYFDNPKDLDTLSVHGYVGVSWLGKTVKWKRFKE